MLSLGLATAGGAALCLHVCRRGRSAPEAAAASAFDKAVDRSAYPSVKHGLASAVLGEGAEGAMKLWLADMELECCPEIQRAIAARAAHAFFGYTLKPPGLWRAVARWLVEEQNWAAPLEEQAFAWSPTVIGAAASALRALTEPGDAVLALTPLYAPLQRVVEGSGRELVTLQMARDGGGRYSMDLDSAVLGEALSRCKALILCNPHNPTGRAWTAEELERLAELCAAHSVLVLADEIWGDWCLWGKPFQPFRNSARRHGCAYVALGAPTKTWSLAGVHAAFLVIEDEALMRRFMAYVEPAFLACANTFASTAMLAAYEHGKGWLAAAKLHVQGNIAFLEAFLARHVPEVRALRPEATYNVWLDCSGLGMAPKDLAAFMLRRAGLALARGADFDAESGHFQRINVACPRPMLEEALGKLKAAVEAWRSTCTAGQ